MYRKTRAEGFGDEVKRRIMIGTYVLSHGYYDAYYLQAQKIRRMIADDFQQAFKQCDVIAGPVAPTVAWKLGENGNDPLADYLADIFTLPASLAGLPGMSVPAGFGEGGMPVGLQLIGNYLQEARCSTPPHRCSRPPTSTPQARGILRPPHEHCAPRRPVPAGAGYEVVIGFETHAQLSTQQDLQPRRHRLWRRAQHPGLRGGPGAARHAAGDEPRRGRARDRIRSGHRFAHCAAQHLRPQELLLPRSAQGLPDQPVRDSGGAGRQVEFFLGTRKKACAWCAPTWKKTRASRCTKTSLARSGIDLNRAGTPLLEIVTEPDMRSSAEAVAYAKELHKIVTWIGICDGNMQEGSFRCDANVSVRKPGAPLGTRREIKNLNSFKFMQQAIDYEIRWQIEQIEDGHAIQQATVLFNPDTGETRAMRTKEDAADYRYFPDPDLPPLVIAPQLGGGGACANGRAAARDGAALCGRLRPARVRRHHADAEQGHGGYFEAAAKACGQPSWPATGSWAKCRAA
jgi:hypothetical protein